MRIYTASSVSPYTVHSNHLNAFVNLLPGTYNFTVQAWDNCGVLKSGFTQAVGGQADAYLYAVNKSAGNVAEFKINNGVLTNPNGNVAPPQFAAGSSPNYIAVDPGGWFAYVLAQDGVHAYQINQTDGALVPVPGSPFAINGQKPSDIVMDPNGNFVFISFQSSNTVSVYRVDRSSGGLTNTATVQLSGGIYAVNSDFSGQYLYAINQNFSSVQVFGYKINMDNGDLSGVPGSPYTIPNADSGIALTPTKNYLYAGTGTVTGEVFGYSVNFSTGALTQIAGATGVVTSEVMNNPQAVLADNQARHLWSTDSAPTTTPQNWFTKYDILSGGSLGNNTTIQTGSLMNAPIAEDGSGKYLYVAGADQNNCSLSNCPNLLSSYTISSNGDPTKLSGPLQTGTQSSAQQGIGVSRKFGD
jgi:6-phosphogluconolactonase (cycloisomerase 2 family)